MVQQLPDYSKAMVPKKFKDQDQIYFDKIKGSQKVGKGFKTFFDMKYDVKIDTCVMKSRNC